MLVAVGVLGFFLGRWSDGEPPPGPDADVTGAPQQLVARATLPSQDAVADTTAAPVRQQQEPAEPEQSYAEQGAERPRPFASGLRPVAAEAEATYEQPAAEYERWQPEEPAYDPEPVAARSVYYANCSAARAAGAAPVRAGDPGYAPHLDRDRDGVGCE